MYNKSIKTNISYMRKILQMVLAASVIGIGVYMFFSFDWPTPPAISGLAFFLTGLWLWLPNCPICNKICKK